MSLEPNVATVDSYKPFNYYWLLWKFFGLQPPNRKSKWFIPYIVYTLLLNFSILLFTTSLIINLILSKSMSELCENICNTTSSFICCFKFFNILVVRQKLLKISNILSCLDARAKNPNEIKLLTDATASCRKLVTVFSILSLFFVASCHSMAYVSSERILVVPTWYPWDWRASKRNYMLAYWYEMYAISFHVLTDTTCNTYPPICLIILSAQVKALALRIKNLGNDRTVAEARLYEDLKDCIRDHNNIYKLFENIQTIISTACLAQFMATGLSQCTMGVHMIYVAISPAKLLHIFIYFFAVTMEIFLLCYYGDLYCQSCEHLTTSIYACNWMERDIKFRKAFLLLLQRSQVPTTIRAGNLIPVQMPTFVKILKTAYSVFTVLNKAN